jgi:putative PIN family toxin of toxin-antitoxin system
VISLKVVLDTNVLISAFLQPGRKPSRILRLIIQGDLRIVINDQILAEYTEVALRPIFQLNEDKVLTVLDYLRSVAIHAPTLAVVPSLPDPGDEPFLEAALSAKADFLITGNRKHYPAKACKDIKVVTPAEFFEKIASNAES